MPSDRVPRALLEEKEMELENAWDDIIVLRVEVMDLRKEKEEIEWEAERLRRLCWRLLKRVSRKMDFLYRLRRGWNNISKASLLHLWSSHTYHHKEWADAKMEDLENGLY